MQAEEVAVRIEAISQTVVQAFHSFIREKIYTRSHYGPCVYYNKLPTGEYIYLLLYVDDMLIPSKSRCTINTLKKDLSSEFEMKDLGEAKKVIGMKITRDRRSGKVSLTQKVAR